MRQEGELFNKGVKSEIRPAFPFSQENSDSLHLHAEADGRTSLLGLVNGRVYPAPVPKDTSIRAFALNVYQWEASGCQVMTVTLGTLEQQLKI